MNVERLIELLFYLVIVIIVGFFLLKIVDAFVDDNAVDMINLMGVLHG